MKSNLFWSLIFLAIQLNFSIAQDNLSAGHLAFEQGDYKTAESSYLAELESGTENFELFYNLGTTYCKMGDLAQGRLYLEKAVLINPRDKAAQKNLKWIRTELSEFLAPIPEFFLIVGWKKVSSALNFKIWYFFSFFFLLLAAFLLWQMLFSNKKRFGSKFFLPGIGLVIILTLLSFFLGNTRYHQLTAKDQFIVLNSEALLKTKPETEAEIIQSLIPGTKVKTDAKLGDWYKITVEDGSKGWTKGENLAEISL